jgi:hypothetical protein
MIPFKFLLACGALALAASAHADDGLFHLDTTVSGVHTTASYSSVEAAFDALRGTNLQTINPAYTGTQAALVSIDYRGVTLSATYGGAGSSALSLNIPTIGLVRTFDAGSRDATQQLLKDYFKQNADDVLGRLSKGLAKSSPVDPIAGNPNSLMSQLVASDFGSGFFDQATTAIQGPAPGLGAVGAGYNQVRDNGTTTHAYRLPLTYSFRSDDDPRRQFTIRVPLATTETEGSRAYYAGIGASLGLPITDRWSVTPSVDYAVAGSRDLGSLAGMAGASLTSSYVLPFERFDVAIGDMVGYYKALRVKNGDYGYDPGIANTVVRNGVLVSQPIVLSGRDLALQYSLVDTHFFGDALYARHYDEVGVSVGTDRRAVASKGDVRAGASFLFSPKIKGFSASVRVRF